MTDATELTHPEVLVQISNLNLAADKPLLICDGDEVIFAFVEGLEIFLRSRDMYLDLASFALTGNIRRQSDNEAVEAADVRLIIQDFHAERMEYFPLVQGAVSSLGRLAEVAQIVVLTNIKFAHKAMREAALLAQGLNFPVIANTGRKGPAVADMIRDLDCPVIFMDDISHNINSVAKYAPRTQCIHFIGDSRLAALSGTAEGATVRIDDWPTAEIYIKKSFNQGAA